ncbi:MULTISPECIES: hypothetical protein [unclassified Streptomyces]|uniref:hypothetical protein n=1 Tax=Streptomyces sp. cf386 TaxID=1761904 RepID=UPI00088E8875|nr:hypothetical protein [Streptomyces sp. cf386]SDO75844.1 hypothetical protein SAMN04487981_11331 [Streptomyces sp. cf386]
MSVFIQQLPALIGVVIGALGSYVVVVRGDQARFRREQAARWEERRLAVYGDYARSVKKAVTVAYRVAAERRIGTHPHPLTLDAAQPLLAEANDERDPSGEALIMLGSVAVVEKARAWVTTAMEMERFLRDGGRDREAWQALLERQRAGREGYYTAVREDLGLPPGHSARWPILEADPVSPQR